MDPLPDRSTLTQIKQYKIVRELGRGAMGTVYEGVDARDGSRVALKILHPELAASDPTFRDRFEREAHVAALLRSPYTVHLNDFGVANGIYFLVMEYVEGEALAQALNNGALEPSRALQVAIAVARALEEANARGVVHRDIKPDNILLADDGGVKVADFGIARQEGGAGATVVGGYVGTPAYSAPEQARGDADSRTDIYALGATLYCMLAGHPPFTGSSGREVLYQHQYSPVPMQPLSWLPDAITNPIRRCLEKDPRDRYQTASELAGALERATRGLTLSGLQPPPPPQPVERPSVAPLVPPPAPSLPASAAALDETLDVPPLVAAASLAGEDTVTLSPPSPAETVTPAAATTLVPPSPATVLPEVAAATALAASATAASATSTPAATEVSLATPTTVAPSQASGNGAGSAMAGAAAGGAAVGAVAAGSGFARVIDAPPAAPPPTAVGAVSAGSGSGGPPKGRSKTKLFMFFGGAAIVAIAAVGGALALSGGGGGSSPASVSATATATATQKPGSSAVASNSPNGDASPSPADPGSPTPTLPPGVTPTTAPPNNGGGNNNPPNNGGGNNNPPNNGGGGTIPTPIPPTNTPVPPAPTPVPPTPTPKPSVKLAFENFYIALAGDPQPSPNTDFDPPAGYQLYSSGSSYNSCNKRIVGVYAFSHSDSAAYTSPNRVVVDYSWTWEGSGQGGGTWQVRRDRTWYGMTNSNGLPNGSYVVTLTDEISGVTVSGRISLSCQFG